MLMEVLLDFIFLELSWISALIFLAGMIPIVLKLVNAEIKLEKINENTVFKCLSVGMWVSNTSFISVVCLFVCFTDRLGLLKFIDQFIGFEGS